MKIGVLTVLFYHLPFEEALDTIRSFGLDAVEVGTGAYTGNIHCDPARLLADPQALGRFRRSVSDRGLEISALSFHANMLHPDRAVAAEHDRGFRDTVRLAAELGIDRVITFSGCPGDKQGGTTPNWITCPWPPEFVELVSWQWDQAIAYWQEAARWCREQGVEKIAIEMHPGFLVYNPETLLRLRAAVGESIGVNFDPSHLFWQSIDPVEAVRALGPAIYHVHVKDTAIDPLNTRVNGVLDTKRYSDEINRAWIFRTIGYGHGEEFWRTLLSALRLVGYDGVLSIEHEDSLMSSNEGLQRAVGLLQAIVLREPGGGSWVG